MFIGYQDVDIKVYDDQSEDFYHYLEDSEPLEDEFLRRFVKRKLKDKKKLIKGSLFGFGGMGILSKIFQVGIVVGTIMMLFELRSRRWIKQQA